MLIAIDIRLDRRTNILRCASRPLLLATVQEILECRAQPRLLMDLLYRPADCVDVDGRRADHMCMQVAQTLVPRDPPPGWIPLAVAEDRVDPRAGQIHKLVEVPL